MNARLMKYIASHRPTVVKKIVNRRVCAAKQESAADERARGFDCLFHVCCGHLALTSGF